MDRLHFLFIVWSHRLCICCIQYITPPPILAFVNCGRLVAAADVLRQSSCYTTETSAGPASAHSSDCASCCFYARRTELFLNCCKPDLADRHWCLLIMPREYSYSHRRQRTSHFCSENKKEHYARRSFRCVARTTQNLGFPQVPFNA